jgi:capsular exopolysaccharide synthesis family protein
VRTSGESQQGITVQFVLTAMRQWWKVAIPVGLVLAAICGAVIYLLVEPVYEASAWLRIADNAPYLAYPAEGGQRRFERFVQTQEELIRSPLVLGPVLSQPEIARVPEIKKAKDPIQWLSKTIEVSPVGQSELFKVSYACPDPENSAGVVNAVVDEYFRLRGRTEAERTERVIELLEEERERRQAEVSRLRENVRELAKQLLATGKVPFAPKPAQESLIQHPLAELQARLTEAVVEREVLEATIKASEDLAPEERVEVPDGMVENAVEKNAEVQARKAQLLAKRAKLQEYKSKLVQGEKDPIYQRFHEEIKRDEQMLDDLRADLREHVKAELEMSLANTRQEDLANMRAQLSSYRLMERLLQERYDTQMNDIVQGTGDTLELQFAQADLSRAEQVFELIAQRVVQLRTEQRAPARVVLLQQAAVPTAPATMPYVRIALALLGSLFLPFGLAVLRERLVRRVTDAQQLEEHSNLAVVGEVARLPVRTTVLSESSSKRVGRALGIFEESIDSLRTCLILSEPLRDMKVLAVTSSTNREGKTSVAVQLAVSLARASGEPTLLIDGDMRSPDIHNLLNIPLNPGLGDVLAEQCSLKDAIVTDWSEALHLLPAGKLHASPHTLLGNGVVDPLFEEVRRSYRYIVVDTPPVLAAGEALVLARAADASLLCAMRDVSRLDQIRKTHQRLQAAGARPVGIVLSGIPPKRYTYRYGNYVYSQE